MSDDEDPLNIGNFKPSERKKIAITNVQIKSRPSSEKIDLFNLSITPTTKRRKSLLKIKKSINELELGLNSSNENSMEINLSPSLPILTILNVNSPNNPNKTLQEDFSVFFVKEKGAYKPSNSLKQARFTLMKRSIDLLNNLFDDLKTKLNEAVLNRSEEMRDYELVLNKLQTTKRKGLEKNRKNAVLHLIYHKKKGKNSLLKSRVIRKNMEKTAMFIEFLKNLIKKDGILLPAIDFDSFQNSLEDFPKKCQELNKFVDRIQPHLKEIEEEKPDSMEWYDKILHPDTKSGKIICEFENRINEFGFDDAYSIIEFLSKKNNLKIQDVEQLIFDLAWVKRPYPFVKVKKAKLPASGDLFPAVIGKTLIPDEFAYTPFSTLNSMQWPFKSAVDLIFGMFIQTNPFSIAQTFYDVIQEAAKCMQKVMVVDKGIRSEDVEIDFDSLFPILMICVFVFGIDEWMDVAIYTMFFNEVSNDSQIQFSMTYLEGLVTHITALDRKSLKEKAIKLRSKWADEMDDPLGIQHLFG